MKNLFVLFNDEVIVRNPSGQKQIIVRNPFRPITSCIRTCYWPVTLKKVEVSKKFPNPLKAPLSAAPKVPEVCPEVEGNPEP